MYGENTEDYDLEEQASIVAKAMKIRLERVFDNEYSTWLYEACEEWDFEETENLEKLVIEFLAPVWRELNK